MGLSLAHTTLPVRVVHTLPPTATPAEALGVDMLDQYSGCGEWSCGLPAAELWLGMAYKYVSALWIGDALS